MIKIKTGKIAKEAVYDKYGKPDTVQPRWKVGEMIMCTEGELDGAQFIVRDIGKWDKSNGYTYTVIPTDQTVAKYPDIHDEEGDVYGFEGTLEDPGFVVMSKAFEAVAKEAVSLGQVDGSVVGGGGPVNVVDPVKDFERNLGKLEKLIKIGNTTKKVAKNNYKIKDGKVEGSIEEKEESFEVSKIELEKADKSAKESVERNAILKKAKPASNVVIGLAGEHAPRTSPDLKDTYYGYAFVQHPFLGDFYISMGTRGDVRTDGRPWNFLQESEYSLTDAQKEFVNQYRKELASQAKRGEVRIVIPLVSNDSNLSPKKYSLEAFEAVATELDATLPKELLNDPSEVNFKKILGVRAEAERQKQREEEANVRRSEAEKKAAPIIEKIKAAPKVNDIDSNRDQISVAFNELVPNNGKAETLAGEIIRAAMRIIYRWWNDGDYFFEGYGLETVAPSVEWLVENNVMDEDFFEEVVNEVSKFMPDDDYGEKQREDTYKRYLIKFANLIIEYVLNRPELFTEVDFTDSREGDEDSLTWIKDIQPKYDYDVEIPEEVMKHINAGNITTKDLESEVYYWEPAGILGEHSDEIYVQGDYLYIIGTDIDTYKELSEQKPGQYPNMYKWLEEYGQTLDEEYGDHDEEPEDEEDDDDSAEESIKTQPRVKITTNKR